MQAIQFDFLCDGQFIFFVGLTFIIMSNMTHYEKRKWKQ